MGPRSGILSFAMSYVYVYFYILSASCRYQCPTNTTEWPFCPRRAIVACSQLPYWHLCEAQIFIPIFFTAFENLYANRNAQKSILRPIRQNGHLPAAGNSCIQSIFALAIVWAPNNDYHCFRSLRKPYIQYITLRYCINFKRNLFCTFARHSDICPPIFPKRGFKQENADGPPPQYR